MPVIERVRITPVAFADPPLLDAVGVQQPYALRVVIELETDAGLVGLGETYADSAHLRRLGSAGRTLVGRDVFALNPMYAAVREALAGERGSDGHGLTGMITTSSTVDRIFSPFQVAALDVQGQLIGRPVSDLLGGAVRERVRFSGYLFYKWAGHPGAELDAWGEALTPGAIVAQAERMVAEYGFTALKLKGGVMDPDAEIASAARLGVQLDRDRLGALHEQYLRCGIRDRDDTGYRRSLEPGYAPRTW